MNLRIRWVPWCGRIDGQFVSNKPSQAREPAITSGERRIITPSETHVAPKAIRL